MDKLTTQTVYVPVPIAGYDLTGKVSVPMLSLTGNVNQVFVDAARKKNTWRILDKQDNRIVLTPGELLQFAREAVQASETMLPEQFLKSKGIEL